MDLTIDGIADDIGPSKVLWIRRPSVGLEAILVVDNVACGPSIGGIRMAADITAGEVARLARAMTFKNAAAGLPHGGGKAGIIGDPSVSVARKEELVRAFARAIRDVTEYIPGPDMGLNEQAMAWIKDEIGRVVGLPKVLGGIPLDDIGATGHGLAISAEVAAPRLGLDLQGARFVVQGFGAVGTHAARLLEKRGGKLVAVADSRGAIFNADGLPVEQLIAHKRSGRPLHEFAQGRPISGDDLIGVDCDIWIPAARPDVLNGKNVSRLKARLVLQGANIPATGEAEQWMHENGILNIPDFVANAGGVICASVEYHGGNEPQAIAAIEERIRSNTYEMLERAAEWKCTPRQAAVRMTQSRIEEAMRYRKY